MRAGARWAIAVNWLQVAALIAYGGYTFSQGGSPLNLLDDLLAVACLLTWVPLLTGYLRGQSGAGRPELTALQNLFPLLTLWRLMEWTLLSLGVAMGNFAYGTHPLTLIALFLVWGASIVARSAVYAVSCSQFAAPSARGRASLLHWLNWLAALELALMVFNAVSYTHLTLPTICSV